ncbi:MAG: MFS transporter, partial [Cyanobacteria bacterium P01_H01_bin.119]
MAHPSTGTASPSTADSWVVKATLLLASTLTVMSGATIAPSLPAMQIYFGETTNVDFWVRLVLTMPALFIVMGSPIAGQLVDQVGRKPLLIGAAALYGFAGGSGLVLNSLPTILMGRALLGLAVAGVMVSATTLIADYYQGDARASFMGLQAAFMGLGGVLFLTVGGFVSDINWRLPFAIYLLAWLLLPTMISALPEPQRQNSVNDSSPNDAPIEHLPLKLMAFICASALLTQMIFYLIPVQLPFYLKQLSNANATQSGLAIALSTLLSAVASMNYGKLKQRLSFIKILAIALVLMGLGYGGIGLAQT